MKVAGTLLLLLACLAGACADGVVDEPAAPAGPRAIIRYHDSGEWDEDTSAVVDRAKRALERHLGDATPRPAMVLDVDDTSLSTYDCLKRFHFDRQAADGTCGESGELPAIPQTLALYRYARQHGVTVFFITRRRRKLRESTIANLRSAGFAGPLRLVMRPNRERPDAPDGFKARARRRIERRGHEIVVNLGDQHSDLDGGHPPRGFKLPNPMYVIPSA